MLADYIAHLHLDADHTEYIQLIVIFDGKAQTTTATTIRRHFDLLIHRMGSIFNEFLANYSHSLILKHTKTLAKS